MMSALIGDIATDRVDPKQANAICNAGGKLLKVVEMQQKYLDRGPDRAKKRPADLQLVQKGK